MTAAEVAAFLARLRHLVRRTGRTSTARSVPSSAPRTGSRCNRRRALARRQRRHRHRLVRPARVPAVAARLDPAIAQLTTASYRNPGELARGRRARRRRLGDRRAARRRARPRRSRRAAWPSAATPACRGATGAWTSSGGSTRSAPSTGPSTRCSDAARPAASASLQLVGRADHRDVDLPALQRSASAWPGDWWASTARASASRTTCRSRPPPPTARLERILDQDRRPHRRARAGRRRAAPGARGVRSPTEPIDELDLRDGRSAPSIWATGFTRPYPWLHVPVLDHRRRDQPTAAASRPYAGLYVLGQRFQHRGDSNFIDGVRHDAASSPATSPAGSRPTSRSPPTPRTNPTEAP